MCSVCCVVRSGVAITNAILNLLLETLLSHISDPTATCIVTSDHMH